MRAHSKTLLASLLLSVAGCESPARQPCGESFGARDMVGCRLSPGEQPALDGKYTGFLLSSDKPDHYSVGWIDSLDAASSFSGTLSVDDTIDPRAIHGHTGNEVIHSDSPNQLSFESSPGNRLDGIDFTTSSPVIYLDGFMNGSRLGFTVSFVGPFYNDYSGSWTSQTASDRDPVAFTSAQAE